MTSRNLDDRLYDNINYTFRDDILFSIRELFTCPITLEIPEDPVIFNHHF